MGNLYVDTETTGLNVRSVPYLVCYALDDGIIKRLWLAPIAGVRSTGTRAELKALMLKNVVVGANVWFDVRMLVQTGLLSLDEASTLKTRDVLLEAYCKRGLYVGLKQLAEAVLHEKASDEEELVRAVRERSGRKRASKGFCKTHGYLVPELVGAYCESDIRMTRTLAKRYVDQTSTSEFQNRANRMCMFQTLRGVRVDMTRIRPYTKKLFAEVHRLKERIPFNASSARQVASALGLRNAQRKTLDEIPEDSEVRAVATDVCTWKDILRVLSFLKALCADPDTGRVHPLVSFTAVTGRARCSSPNLQQLPSHPMAGVDVRTILLADNDGSAVVSCDYDQIELRLYACLFEIKELMEAFLSGADVHTVNTVALTKSEPMRFMELAARKHEKRLTKAQLQHALDEANGNIVEAEHALGIASTRSLIKRFTFASIYGAQDPKLASILDAPISMVCGIRAAMEARCRTHAYRTQLAEFRKRGSIITPYGRRIVPSSEHAWVNSLIQGTAADVLHRGAVRLEPALADSGRVMITIHDEVLASVKRTKVHVAVKVIERTMRCDDFTVPLTASGKVHPNGRWGVKE